MMMIVGDRRMIIAESPLAGLFGVDIPWGWGCGYNIYCLKLTW